MRRRFFVLIVVVCLLLGNVEVVFAVNAGVSSAITDISNTGSNSSSSTSGASNTSYGGLSQAIEEANKIKEDMAQSATGGNSAEEAVKALAKQIDSSRVDEVAAVIKELWGYLTISYGMSEAGAAGILGNMWAESNFKDYNTNPVPIKNKDGNVTAKYWGYFMMQDNLKGGGTWNNFLTWASGNSLDYKSVSAQCRYALEAAINGAGRFSKYEVTMKNFKTTNDVVYGTEAFMVGFEGCGSDSSILTLSDGTKIECQLLASSLSGEVKSTVKKYWQHRDKRVEYATKVYEALTGITVTTGGNANIGSLTETGLYFSEDEVSAWRRINEAPIPEELLNPDRSDLSQDEVASLANWERNVVNKSEGYGIVGFMRWLVMVVGILIIMWCVAVYLCYWLDRVNNFIEFEFLSFVTFGRLHISDTEESCTFRVQDMGKTEKKTVNHRAIVGICLTGIFFSVFVISGTFYKAIRILVNFIIRTLGVWF